MSVAGSPDLGGFIPMWGFGRQYYEGTPSRSLRSVRPARRDLTRRALRSADHLCVGQSLNRVPEPALPLLLGVAGSAFCASVARAWEEAKDTLSPDLARIISAVLSEVRSSVPPAAGRQWLDPYTAAGAAAADATGTTHPPHRNCWAQSSSASCSRPCLPTTPAA